MIYSSNGWLVIIDGPSATAAEHVAEGLHGLLEPFGWSLILSDSRPEPDAIEWLRPRVQEFVAVLLSNLNRGTSVLVQGRFNSASPTVVKGLALQATKLGIPLIWIWLDKEPPEALAGQKAIAVEPSDSATDELAARITNKVRQANAANILPFRRRADPDNDT